MTTRRAADATLDAATMDVHTHTEEVDRMPETSLAPVAPLKQALALAAEAGDINALRDVTAMATALQKGAKARGLGIAAENEAAEVVLRAERAIGTLLADVPREPRGPNKGEGGRMPDGTYFTGRTPTAGQTKFAAFLKETGIPATAAHNWQRLARLPDDTFEGLLAEARASGARIAKVNFYYRKPEVAAVERPGSPASSPDFSSLRAGAMRLLGWEVGPDGTGHATKNGLTNLPDDELRLLASLLAALVAAYQEVRSAR